MYFPSNYNKDFWPLYLSITSDQKLFLLGKYPLFKKKSNTYSLWKILGKNFISSTTYHLLLVQNLRVEIKFCNKSLVLSWVYANCWSMIWLINWCSPWIYELTELWTSTKKIPHIKNLTCKEKLECSLISSASELPIAHTSIQMFLYTS